MLRTSTSALTRGLARSVTAGNGAAAKRPPNLRANYSTPSAQSKSGGGGGKAAAAAVALTVGAAGGAVGYASYDPEFRRLVEEVVPGAEQALAAILGEPEAVKPKDPSPTKIPVTAVPPSKKRPISQEAIKKAEEARQLEKKEKDDTLVIVSAPPLEKPAFMQDGGSKKRPIPLPKAETTMALTSAEKAAPEKSVEATKELSKEAKKVEEAQTASPSKEEKKKSSRRKAVEVSEEEERAILEGKDLHRQISLVKQNMEVEMVDQLRRQAEAHSDHLEDALEVQKNELTRKYRRELDEALEKSELAYREEMARIVGHLRGLNEGLQGRARMDHCSLQAQELWLACSALLQAVASGSTDLQVRSLYDELQAIKKAVSAEGEPMHDKFVAAIVESIPEEAATRGVYTEDSIRERFRRVEKVAKRTAMIGEDGGSLFKYFLSYLQSLFILSPSVDELPNKTVPVDIDGLGTFDIVWLAKCFLERGDLDQAVRYMTLLKGEPRNVARDWLREARLLLETKQACQALMAHAAAVGVEALPQRK